MKTIENSFGQIFIQMIGLAQVTKKVIIRALVGEVATMRQMKIIIKLIGKVWSNKASQEFPLCLIHISMFLPPFTPLIKKVTT